MYKITIQAESLHHVIVRGSLLEAIERVKENYAGEIIKIELLENTDLIC